MIRGKYVVITVHEQETQLNGKWRDHVNVPPRKFRFITDTGRTSDWTESEYKHAIQAHRSAGALVEIGTNRSGTVERVHIDYYLKGRNGFKNGSYNFRGARLMPVPETFEEYAEKNNLRDCKETRQAFEDAKKNAEEL